MSSTKPIQQKNFSDSCNEIKIRKRGISYRIVFILFQDLSWLSIALLRFSPSSFMCFCVASILVLFFLWILLNSHAGILILPFAVNVQMFWPVGSIINAFYGAIIDSGNRILYRISLFGTILVILNLSLCKSP